MSPLQVRTCQTRQQLENQQFCASSSTIQVTTQVDKTSTRWEHVRSCSVLSPRNIEGCRTCHQQQDQKIPSTSKTITTITLPNEEHDHVSSRDVIDTTMDPHVVNNTNNTNNNNNNTHQHTPHLCSSIPSRTCSLKFMNSSLTKDDESSYNTAMNHRLQSNLSKNRSSWTIDVESNTSSTSHHPNSNNNYEMENPNKNNTHQQGISLNLRKKRKQDGYFRTHASKSAHCLEILKNVSCQYIFNTNKTTTLQKKNNHVLVDEQSLHFQSLASATRTSKTNMKYFLSLLFIVIYILYSWSLQFFHNHSLTLIPFVSASSSKVLTSETDYIGSYIVQDISLKFCLSCKIDPSKKETMIFFTENVNISTPISSPNTQLLFMAFGNSDFSSIDITLRAPFSTLLPPSENSTTTNTTPPNYLLILSSTQVLNFNIVLDSNFPLNGIVTHSPLQNSVLISPLYPTASSDSHQKFPSIPITYFCRSGEKCSHDILTEEPTFKIEYNSAFVRAMSQELGFQWRASMACEKGTRLLVQPKELPCIPLTDEVIIYLSLVVVVFVAAFLSCIGMVLLRWYCVRKRQREECARPHNQNLELEKLPTPHSFFIENGDMRVYSPSMQHSNGDHKV